MHNFTSGYGLPIQPKTRWSGLIFPSETKILLFIHENFTHVCLILEDPHIPFRSAGSRVVAGNLDNYIEPPRAPPDCNQS